MTAARDPAIEILKTKMGDAGIGVEVEIKSEKAKEVVENALVKVEEVEAKSALKKDEVGVESGVINVAEAKARNEKDEVKVMKGNEAEAKIEVKFKPKSINDNLASRINAKLLIQLLTPILDFIDANINFLQQEDFVESAVVVPAEDRHLLPLLRDLAVDLDALEAVHQLTFH